MSFVRQPSGWREVSRRRGLTLVEVLLAMGLLGLIVSITYMSFGTAVRSWRSGTRLADHLTHADFAIEQLATALRSAYYADTGRVEARYGFVHQPNGSGAYAADSISWVKLGGALVGGDPALSGTPHRVEVFVQPEMGFDDGLGYGLGVRSWRIDAQAEDFDPDLLDPVFLSPRVLGLQCRMADPDADADAEPGVIEWIDTWDEAITNRLPRAVELTLYVEAPRPGSPPLEVRRIVQIPMAELSWNPIARATERRVYDARRGRPPGVQPGGGATQPRPGATPRPGRGP